MDLTGKKALAFKLAYMHVPFNAWRPFAAGCRHSALGAGLQSGREGCTALRSRKTSIQGDADKWQHSSHLPNLNYGRPTLRHVPPVVTELRPASFDSLPWRIADGEIIGSTDAQLARLATAAGHAAHDVRIVCF